MFWMRGTQRWVRSLTFQTEGIQDSQTLVSLVISDRRELQLAYLVRFKSQSAEAF